MSGTFAGEKIRGPISRRTTWQALMAVTHLKE